MYKNKSISIHQFNTLTRANRIEEYYTLALQKLAISSFSNKKIEEILIKKGATKEICKIVLERVRKLNFIDEKKIIEEIISFCDLKHYGFIRLKKMLYDRRISEKEIRNVEYNSKREEEQAFLLIKNLEKKYAKNNNTQRKSKVYSALLRNGFEEQLSLELVNKYANSNHINEINVLQLDYAKSISKFKNKYHGADLSKKITNYLLSKGYKPNDINFVKENFYEMDKRTS